MFYFTFFVLYLKLLLYYIYIQKKGSIKMNNNHINRNQIYFNLFHLHTCTHFNQFIYAVIKIILVHGKYRTQIFMRSTKFINIAYLPAIT